MRILPQHLMPGPECSEIPDAVNTPVVAVDTTDADLKALLQEIEN